MEKGEPTLVPEWLKNTGNHSSSSSTSHIDANSATKLSRNKSFVSKNGNDLGKSSGFDRTTSSHFRRSSSSNGSAHLRSYNNFGRSLHDRDWEKDDYYSRDKDTSDSLEKGVSGKIFRNGLRNSQSVKSGKNNDTWTKKVESDTSPEVSNINFLFNNGVPAVGTNKVTFERNFPSLGVEDRASITDIGRIPSPGLNSAIRILPTGTLTAIGGEKWTSVLAEVPVSVGNNGVAGSFVQQTMSTPNLATNAYLNMAETAAQNPNHASSLPQLSIETQRLEELAIRQSRQLIPVTPTAPKNLVPSSSDTLKSKAVPQHYHHPPSLLPFYPTPSGVGKGEMSKSNVGKLHVLNPVREKNGSLSIVKDNFVPLTGSGALRYTHSAALSASASASAAAKVPPSSCTLGCNPVSIPEKRTTSQAQSRKEFFSLVRKKSMANSSFGADSDLGSSLVALDTVTTVSQPSSDNFVVKAVVSNPDIQIADAKSNASLNGDFLAEETRDDLTDACDEHSYLRNGKQHTSFDPQIPEEEEAAFLRSMGWEENSDETVLTAEEISGFSTEFEKFINSKPALKILQGLQNKLIVAFDSHLAGIGSGLSSSDAKLES